MAHLNVGYDDQNQAPPPGFNLDYNQDPVISQPRQVMPVPGPRYGDPPGGISPAPVGAPDMVPVGVPPGLEYLAQIDQILIHQKVPLLEELCGYETRYVIKNSMGQEIYCPAACKRSERVLMEVQAPPGTTIGYVKQDWHPSVLRFSIQGADRKTHMRLEGPDFSCNCCSDVNFKLQGKDGNMLNSRIIKQWGGLCREVFTEADNFCIQFPLDMDVKTKAVLMGACLLIDFMFFQNGAPARLYFEYCLNE